MISRHRRVGPSRLNILLYRERFSASKVISRWCLEAGWLVVTVVVIAQ